MQTVFIEHHLLPVSVALFFLSRFLCITKQQLNFAIDRKVNGSFAISLLAMLSGSFKICHSKLKSASSSLQFEPTTQTGKRAIQVYDSYWQFKLAIQSGRQLKKGRSVTGHCILHALKTVQLTFKHDLTASTASKIESEMLITSPLQYVNTSIHFVTNRKPLFCSIWVCLVGAIDFLLSLAEVL